MMTVLTGFPDNVVAVSCEGRVTRKDYDSVLIPAVTTAVHRHTKVQVYYEITSRFTGMDAGAMWEDFLVGMEHLLRWERVAVVTDIEWIRHTVNMFRFLLPGKIRIFADSDAAAARAWIVGSEA